MELFPRNYDMISEVTRLEKMMPSYSEIMHELGRVIRNDLWRISNEDKLAQYLNVCNNLLEITISAIGDNIFIAEFYVKLLYKHRFQYTFYNIDGLFDDVEILIYQEHIKEIFSDQWERINPYYMEEYKNDEAYKKSIIDLIEEILSNSSSKTLDKLYIKEADLSFLCRGRSGRWEDPIDIYPPTIDIALEKNCINRWNPPDRRYIYLVSWNKEKTQSRADKVCLAELRAKKGQIISIVNFKVTDKAKEKILLNLDFDRLSFADIEKSIYNQLDIVIKKDVNDIIDQYPFNTNELNERIKSLTDSQYDDIKEIASEYLAQIFFKYLCDVIFVPLDKNQDSDKDLKDKCYKAFHILALYLEQKGINGIIYPSTRMKLLKKSGTNIVLFDVDDVIHDESSLRFIESNRDYE